MAFFSSLVIQVEGSQLTVASFFSLDNGSENRMGSKLDFLRPFLYQNGLLSCYLHTLNTYV